MGLWIRLLGTYCIETWNLDSGESIFLSLSPLKDVNNDSGFNLDFNNALITKSEEIGGVVVEFM